MKDHVCMCLSIPGKFAVSNVVDYLKGKLQFQLLDILKDCYVGRPHQSNRMRFKIQFVLVWPWLKYSPLLLKSDLTPLGCKQSICCICALQSIGCNLYLQSISCF